MDPTSEDEEWFHQLTAQAPFPCDWKGRLFWDSEASKHAHVIDYYLRDGKARLEGRVRDLNTCSTSPAHRFGLLISAGGLRAFVLRLTGMIPTTATSSRPQPPPPPRGWCQAWS